jgi:hypothetical protein
MTGSLIANAHIGLIRARQLVSAHGLLTAQGSGSR